MTDNAENFKIIKFNLLFPLPYYEATVLCRLSNKLRVIFIVLKLKKQNR